MSAHHIDELAKASAFFGVYFFLQAYGYAQGLRTLDHRVQAPQSINNAIAFGAAHLMHFFRPWGVTAWPLCPFTCIILLGFALFLPSELSHVSEADQWVVYLFYAWLLAMTINNLALFAPGAQVTIRLLRKYETPIMKRLQPLSYLIISCVLAGLFFILIREYASDALARLHEGIWWAPIKAVLIGWLLLLGYFGGYFDGLLDADNGPAAVKELLPLLTNNETKKAKSIIGPVQYTRHRKFRGRMQRRAVRLRS